MNMFFGEVHPLNFAMVDIGQYPYLGILMISNYFCQTHLKGEPAVNPPAYLTVNYQQLLIWYSWGLVELHGSTNQSVFSISQSWTIFFSAQQALMHRLAMLLYPLQEHHSTVLFLGLLRLLANTIVGITALFSRDQDKEQGQRSQHLEIDWIGRRQVV